jgi:hypothetical protein
MWAQLITIQLKPGQESDLRRIGERLHSIEQPDSGLLRSLFMVDQNDPTKGYSLVLFESEEKARDRENDPRRAEGLEEIRGLMAEVVEGAPSFLNLRVIFEG